MNDKNTHYIFSKEGAMETLGLNSLSSLDYHIGKAKKLGVIVSKLIGGVELFNVDCLEYPEDHIPVDHQYDGRHGEQLTFQF